MYENSFFYFHYLIKKISNRGDFIEGELWKIYFDEIDILDKNESDLVFSIIKNLTKHYRILYSPYTNIKYAYLLELIEFIK